VSSSVSSTGRQSAAIRRIADIAGPRGWPVLGNMPQIDVPRVHEQLEAWAAIYGPIYRVRLMFRDALVVSRPDLVAAIFRDRPDGWRRMRSVQSVLRETGTHGVFSAEGDDWRRQRRLVMAAFDPGHLRGYFPSLLRVTERLKQRLDAAARDGEWIDLQRVLMRYTVDVIAGLAFGIDMNTQQDPDNALQSHLDKVFPMFTRRITAAFPRWRYFKLPSDRVFDRHLAQLHAAVRGFVDAARKRIERDPRLRVQPTNLLEAMLAAHDDQTGALSEEELVGNVFTLLLAGEDTTANTLCWTLHLLHEHREAWRELVADVDRSLGADPLPRSFEAAGELESIEHCANESMRLRPVAPLLFMENNRAITLDGIAIPAGSFVICLTRPGAVDALAADDAASFRPSRWRRAAIPVDAGQSDAASRAILKASIPFGAGPRICPGRYLALLEMKMVLAMLARNYELIEVSTDDGAPPQERFAFTMFPVGLRMKIAMRESAFNATGSGLPSFGGPLRQ
jgi:cytochrome P450